MSKDKKKKKRSKCKYIFQLDNIDTLKINIKYGLEITNNLPSIQAHNRPANTTDLQSLTGVSSNSIEIKTNLSKVSPERISFYDEAKRLRSCCLTTGVSTYCWWCKHQ